MSYRPGDVFGPYRVVAGIGRGAMGEVLLVEHVELGAQYALKVLGKELAENAEARDRFVREMASLAAVDVHPGIVRIHASGFLPDGRPYFAMEYVEGRNLTRAIHHQLLGLEEAVEVAAEVAEALGFLHARGLVHRDVKPDNVILAAEGRARLTDFGLAKAIGADDQRLTLTGDLIGTPAYMAPEQAQGQREVTPATDVYACGVLLYEALTGRLPYEARTAIQITRKVANGMPFPKPTRLVVTIPPAVEAVVLKALEFKPQSRYPDGTALAEALRAAIAEPPPPPPRVRPWVVGAVAALCLAAATALWLSQRTPAKPTGERNPAALQTLEAHAERRNWRAIVEARAGVDATWAPTAVERWTELVTRARRELILDAWAKQRLDDGEQAWDAGPPLEDPAAAWLLAALGRTEEIPLGAVDDPSARAWLAAQAGDLRACTAALESLPAREGEVLRWELRGALPQLETPRGLRDEDGVDALIRGVRALALGRLGQAAGALARAEGLPSQLEATRDEARARLALAWGDPGPLAELAYARLQSKLAGVAELRTWVLAREVAPWLSPNARSDLLDPLPARLRDLQRPWLLDTGGRLGRARRQRGDSGAWRAAGADPVLASRSLALADLDACRRGLDGAPGLLLARADAVIAAALRGHARAPLIDRAREWLERVEGVRGETPGGALVRLRLRRLRGELLEDDWELLERVSPGDSMRLREDALATEHWARWSVDSDAARSGEGFARAAAAWARVETQGFDEAEAREATLRRVRALANQAAADGADEAGWAKVSEVLQPRLAQLPVAELASARAELRAALVSGDLERVDALRAELRGVAPGDLDVLYLGAALGSGQAAEAYALLVGDLPALALLELRAAEGADDPVLLRESTRRVAAAHPLPYANLLAAAVATDEQPSPLDLARVVEEAPEELHAVLELLRAAAPPRVETWETQVEASGLGEQRRRVARAVLVLWEDLQGNLASPHSWSLRACELLDAALADDPSDPGALQLRTVALRRPSGQPHADSWVERQVAFDLELASLALPWAAEPRITRLRFSEDREQVARLIDDLGSCGWLWSAEGLALHPAIDPAPRPWPDAVRGLRAWEQSSLNAACMGAAGLHRDHTALALYQLFFDRVRVNASEWVTDTVRTSLERLLKAADDPLQRQGFEGTVLARSAAPLEGEARRTQRLEALRLLSAPGLPRTAVRSLAGLPSGKQLWDLRRTPHLAALSAQDLAMRCGWDASLHRAEVWRALRGGDAPPLFTADELRDPWSRARAILDGLHDGGDPHTNATLAWLRREDPARYALGLVRAAAFDRSTSPGVDLYYRIVWELRYDENATAVELEQGIALTRLFERLDAPTFRGLRSDLLVDLALELPQGREALLEEGLRLGLEVDPQQVSRWCESLGTAIWRRVRCAALADDDAALDAALAALEAARDRWGLDLAQTYEPHAERLAEHPKLAAFFND